MEEEVERHSSRVNFGSKNLLPDSDEVLECPTVEMANTQRMSILIDHESATAIAVQYVRTAAI